MRLRQQSTNRVSTKQVTFKKENKYNRFPGKQNIQNRHFRNDSFGNQKQSQFSPLSSQGEITQNQNVGSPPKKFIRQQTANFSPYSQSQYPKQPFTNLNIYSRPENPYQKQSKAHPRNRNASPLPYPRYIREERSQQIIIEQLIENNKLLNEQNLRLHGAVKRLERDLVNLQFEFDSYLQSSETAILNERLRFQELEKQMSNQIQVVLQKNDILNRRISEYTSKLGERQSKQCRYVNNSQQGRVVQQLLDLVNKQQKTKGFNVDNINELVPTISNILKRTEKLESFLSSLLQMKHKITKQQNQDIKACWKWLKSLVHDSMKLNSKHVKILSEIKNVLNVSQQCTEGQVLGELAKRLIDNK